MIPEKQKEIWDSEYQQALTRIERALQEPENPTAEEEDFAKFAKWLLDTPIGTGEFACDKYLNYRTNPFVCADFLGDLHHALLDDGDVSFVQMDRCGKKYRVFMIFHDLFSKDFDKVCREDDVNKRLIRTSIDVNNRLIDFAMSRNISLENISPARKINESDFSFGAHRNPMVFIRQVEDLEKWHEKEREKAKETIREINRQREFGKS